MINLYVICEQYFEYNDETYDARGVETLTKAFKNKEKADTHCVILNFKAMKKYQGELFSYGGYDVPYTKEGKTLLETWGIDPNQMYNQDEKLEKLTDSQLIELIPHMTHPFYQVYEVEAGE